MSEWVSERVNEWMSEWVNEWMKEWRNEGRNEGMKEGRHKGMKAWRHEGMKAWRHEGMKARMHDCMIAWLHECMNAWTHECMNAWMHECMNAWVHECMTSAWVHECMSAWMHACMHEWMHEWMNEWMNGWMNEWMNEWMSSLARCCSELPHSRLPLLWASSSAASVTQVLSLQSHPMRLTTSSCFPAKHSSGIIVKHYPCCSCDHPSFVTSSWKPVRQERSTNWTKVRAALGSALVWSLHLFYVFRLMELSLQSRAQSFKSGSHARLQREAALSSKIELSLHRVSCKFCRQLLQIRARNRRNKETPCTTPTRRNKDSRTSTASPGRFTNSQVVTVIYVLFHLPTAVATSVVDAVKLTMDIRP